MSGVVTAIEYVGIVVLLIGCVSVALALFIWEAAPQLVLVGGALAVIGKLIIWSVS